jgi:hypothetical protein
MRRGVATFVPSTRLKCGLEPIKRQLNLLHLLGRVQGRFLVRAWREQTICGTPPPSGAPRALFFGDQSGGYALSPIRMSWYLHKRRSCQPVRLLPTSTGVFCVLQCPWRASVADANVLQKGAHITQHLPHTPSLRTDAACF